METATVDGITSTSASESAEQINAALSYSDDQGSAPESQTQEPAAAAEPKQKKGSYQARIDELTAKLANTQQSQAVTNDAIAKIEALERKLASLESRPVERPQERPAPRDEQDAEPTEDQFESYRDFVKAQANWEVRQALQARDRETAQRQRHESQQQFEARRHADFAERLKAAEASDPNFAAVLASPVMLSAPMQDAIKDSAIAPQLMTYLHEHQDEAERIYRAGSPLTVFKEMNKLEARLEAAVDRGPAPKAKPVSQAKPPIKPLGAASSAASDGPPGDDASYEEHERYWNAQELKKQQGR